MDRTQTPVENHLNRRGERSFTLHTVDMNTLQYLTSVDVTDTDFRTWDLIHLLASAPALHTLAISNCVIGPRAFAKHPIKFLNLVSCVLNDPDCLLGMSYIVTLKLLACKQLTDKKLVSMVTQLPHLRHLGLGDCNDLTAQSLSSIPSLAPELEYLDLRGIDAVTDALVDLMLRGLLRLQRFKVTITSLSPTTLAVLADRLPYAKKNRYFPDRVVFSRTSVGL